MKLNLIEFKGYTSYKDYNSFTVPQGITGIVGSIGDIDGKSNGCIVGDSIINVNRGKLGKKYIIKEMYLAFRGEKTHKNAKSPWDLSTPTYVRSFNGNTIQLHEIKTVVYSGKKEIYELMLENGRTLKATADHKIMTRGGWCSLINLRKDITEVMCDTLKSKKSEVYKDKSRDLEIYTIPYHKYANKVTKDKYARGGYSVYSRLPKHRLIYEAYLNNVSYDEYLTVLKNDYETSKGLKFIDPKKYDIHHKDFNHYNNDISNLELLTKNEHQQIHGQTNFKNFNQGIPVFSLVKDIQYIGIEDTYDIICKDPHRNFVANGIVIHNSGKSSAITALRFALFGSGTYDRVEEVWNDRLDPKEDAFTKIDFSLIGCNYTITRGRKGKSGTYLDVFQGKERCGDSIAESQAFIDNLLGMDEKLFTASVFFSQGDLAAFIELLPGKRREYLDTLLNLEIWRGAHKKSKTAYKQTLDSIESNKRTHLNKTLELNKLVDETELLQLDMAQLPVYEKQKAEQSIELDNLKNLEKTQTSIKEYEDLLTTNKLELDKVISKKSMIEGDILGIEENYKQVTGELHEFDEFNLDQKTLEVIKLQEELVKINDGISIQESGRKTASDNLLIISTIIKRLESDKSILSVGNCDRCRKPITEDDVLKRITEIDKEIQNQVEFSAGWLKSIETFDKIIKVGEQSRDSNIILYSELKSKIDKFFEISSTAAGSLKKYEETKKRYSDDLISTEQRIKELQALVDNYNNKIKKLKLQLPKDTLVDISSIREKILDLDNKIVEIHTKNGRLQQLNKLIVSLQEDIKNIESTLKELEKKLYYLDVLVKAFKDIPTNLFKKSISAIELFSNEIIQGILPKFKVKIYEDETKETRPLIVAFEVDGKYRNYKLLSGGQKSICAIGLRIGFSKIIAQKSKVSLNFLVLDEIFGSLDDFNRSEVMKTLTSLVKHFPQILVITHTGENTIFPNLLKVQMDSFGISTIS